MKRLVLAFLLLGAAIRADAIDYTDIWYNAAQPGYGFNLVESDDGSGAPFIFVTFYVYGTDGKPTWYVAGLNWNRVDSFTGNVFAATSGTFFGLPWNAANYVGGQVGTATFRPNLSNNYQGTLSYTVTGVGSSTVPLERQTLTAIATGGSYTGGQSGTYSGCTTPANNSSYTDPHDLEVTHGPAGKATYAFTYRSGLTCTLVGTYEQHGQYFRVPTATYVCSDGVNTTAQMSEIKVTSLGIEGRFRSTGVGDNCTEDAVFSGVFLQ